MPTAHEHFSAQFEAWEQRSRGGQVFDRPVYPEPPFVPFSFRVMVETPAVDDGRETTFLSRLGRKLARKPIEETPDEPEAEPEPIPLERGSLVEFQTALPDKLDISKEAFEQFLSSLSFCREPMAFELLGVHQKVTAHFVAPSRDSSLVHHQLQSFFPEAVFIPVPNNLESAWNETTGDEMVAVEFGLDREFMFPLQSGRLDPFIGLIGALAGLQAGELGLFQVLWQPVRHPWANEILDLVTDSSGKPFFVNAPELTSAAQNKVAKPLYAAVVRIMVCAEQFDRAMQLASDLAGSLRVFSHPNGNALVPLRNDAYGFEEHIMDVLRRQTHRTGMLLNSDELTGFVHIPSSSVRSPIFQRQTTKTKAAPNIVRQADGLLLGTNEHAGQTVEVRLSPKQRVYHSHIIGNSGTGKSTLLFNIIRQSMENGEGIAVLDPHGDLIEQVLGVVPESRIDDVIFVDPADEEYAIGFNILSAHSNLEKNLLASDLIAVFQRLSTSWGDQMNSVLQNAILAFLESDRGGTIADLNRFLIEPAFRNEFLKTVRDSHIVNYWQKSFPLLSGNKSIGSILTRLDTFLAQKPIRYMVSQPTNKLDFAHIMDTGKILLAKLPEGVLGKENSHLLGTLLVSKFQQIAMSRQAQRIEARRMFNIVIDEFVNFITPSMAEILSGARKYQIGLTLAHQQLQQLQRSPEVASSVLSNPYTRIVFRVGDDDAKKLAEGFSYFEAKDVRNLETGQAIVRVERSDYDFNLTVPLPAEADANAVAIRRQEVVTASRKKYALPRADVEALLARPITKPQDEPPTPPVHLPPAAKGAAEISAPPSSLPHVPPVVEQKSLALPPTSDISVSATARAGVVKDESSLPPLLTSKPSEPSQVAETPKTSETVRHQAPRDLGRGGAPHKAIQDRLQAEAQKLGFLAEVEKQLVEGSNEAADLLLKRDGIAIAVEITVTTTTSHEFENVQKCLAAGFKRVAVVSTSPKRLEDLAAAVQGGLGSEAAKVSYYSPDDFIAELKTVAAKLNAKPEPPLQPNESKSRGIKVRRHLPKLSDEEQKQKEDIANRMIATAMQNELNKS